MAAEVAEVAATVTLAAPTTAASLIKEKAEQLFPYWAEGREKQAEEAEEEVEEEYAEAEEETDVGDADAEAAEKILGDFK